MRLKIGIYLTVYIVFAFVVGIWSDAMDRRFGVNGGVPISWASNTFGAVLWPISTPLALGMMLTESGGRWQLGRRS